MQSGLTHAATAGGGSIASVRPVSQTSEFAVTKHVAELQRQVATHKNNNNFVTKEMLNLWERISKKEASTELLAAAIEAKHGEVISMLVQHGEQLRVAAKPKETNYNVQASQPQCGPPTFCL